jgi:phosphate transport system substrate-binding protein
MVRFRHLAILLLATALWAGGDLRLAVGITPAQNIFNRIREPFERATGIHLVLVDARSPEAWRLLAGGEVEAASAGLTQEAWLAAIKAKGLVAPAEDAVSWRQIGEDQIQVLTHSGVLVLQLSREDLQGLFTGRVKDWKEVGGDPGPVTVLLDPQQIATNDTFRSQILDGKPFGPTTWTAAAGASMVGAVAATPLSIGFAPKASQESLKVNSPVTPPITRPILLLFKGKTPGANLAKLLAFLESPEGKALIVH